MQNDAHTAQPFARPNDEERGDAPVPSRASLALSSSSVSFSFGEMSSEFKQPINPPCPEGFPPDDWEKLSEADRCQIVEDGRPIFECKRPSWWDTRVTIVLTHDEDFLLIHEVLTTAGVICGGFGSHGIFYCEVPAADREKALRTIRGEPRLEGRYVDLERVPDDQCYQELFRIPRRLAT